MRAAALMLLAALSPALALAHATLVSSSPLDGSKAPTSPPRIRLLFSEPIEAAMSRIVVYEPHGDSVLVAVTRDPRNMHALVGQLAPLGSGHHRVRWQALSTDGHSLTGTFSFTVLSGAGDTSAAATTFDGPTGRQSAGTEPSASNSGRLAMLARGIGMAALLALAGFTFFAARAEPGSATSHLKIATGVAAVSAVALTTHFLLWVFQASAAGFSDGWFTNAMQTTVGRRESVRAGLAVLALAFCWPAHRLRGAMVMAIAALLVSSFIGHAIAIDPIISITSKIGHLVAGAVWLGGLLWLLILDRERVESYAREARKVSAAAGVCVFIVLVTGVLQAGAVLSWNVNALGSPYAIVTAIKLFGFLVLLGFGAYNRFRVLPGLDFRVAGRDLQRTVAWEISVMTVVAVIGGVLAYVTPPVP